MTNKYYGQKTEFQPIREDRTRIIVSYGQESVSDTHCTWYEIYFQKSDTPQLGKDQIKSAIIADIDAHTDEKILSGFVWNDINVWLSAENQRNFSEADRKAESTPDILPITFKIGEDAEKKPVYHIFETYEDLDGFYMQAFAYIQQCLADGWRQKDSIDWSLYGFESGEE